MEKEIEQTQIKSKDKIYNVLVEFMQKNGYAPSMREICAGTYLSSTSSVYSHLVTLEDEGKIQIKKKSNRAIKIIGYEFVKTEEST